MKQKIIIYSILVFSFSPGFSQENTFLDNLKVPDVIDTLFIDRDLNNWSLRGFGGFKVTHFKLSNDEQALTCIPNNPFSAGFGIATRKLLVDFGFNIKTDTENVTKRFDLQGNYLFRKQLFDLSIQNYSGFSIENDLGVPPVFRTDVKVFSFALSYMYVFNAGKYSLLAENTGLSRQKRAASSFSLGGYFIVRDQSADSSLIPIEIRHEFNEEAQIENLFGIGTGIQGSFTCIFPLPFKLFTGFTISPGIGLVANKVETELKSYSPSNMLNFKANAAGSFGYNGKKAYATFRVWLGLDSSSIDYGNKILINAFHAKLALGYKLGVK